MVGATLPLNVELAIKFVELSLLLKLLLLLLVISPFVVLLPLIILLPSPSRVVGGIFVVSKLWLTVLMDECIVNGIVLTGT